MENRLINGKDFICLNVMPKTQKTQPKASSMRSEFIANYLVFLFFSFSV